MPNKQYTKIELQKFQKTDQDGLRWNKSIKKYVISLSFSLGWTKLD